MRSTIGYSFFDKTDYDIFPSSQFQRLIVYNRATDWTFAALCLIYLFIFISAMQAQKPSCLSIGKTVPLVRYTCVGLRSGFRNGGFGRAISHKIKNGLASTETYKRLLSLTSIIMFILQVTKCNCSEYLQFKIHSEQSGFSLRILTNK